MSYTRSTNRFTPAAYQAVGLIPSGAAAAAASSASSNPLDEFFAGLKKTFTPVSSPTPTPAPAPTPAAASSSSGSWLDTLKGILGAGAKTAQEYYQAQGRQQVVTQPAGGGMPSWVMPAMIGGGVLLAVVLLKKKR